MSGRTFPEYYKWVHPNPKANGLTLLVKMEHFGTARFWERQIQDWGPVDMDDLAESLDSHHSAGGVQFEEVTGDEAELLKARIRASFSQS